jgi:hypothetical protein
MLVYFFAGFLKNLTQCMTKLRVLVQCLCYFTDITLVYLMCGWVYLCVGRVEESHYLDPRNSTKDEERKG